MEWLVWLGAAVTLAGIAGLALSILKVRAARRDAADEADMRGRLQRVIPLNLGALLLSALGLCMVMVGLLLG
jgi:hypothetical protein